MNLQRHGKSPVRFPKSDPRRSSLLRQVQLTLARSPLRDRPETALSWGQSSPSVLPPDYPPGQTHAEFSYVPSEGALRKPTMNLMGRMFTLNETRLVTDSTWIVH